ncbi:MAG: ATP-grasp domain-containing protein [Thermoprotei archaeon]
MDYIEDRFELLEKAYVFRKEYEKNLKPQKEFAVERPFIYVSIGGGELGDLVITAAKRIFGGKNGGIRTVVIDRYEGFPAQDVADSYEIIDMLNGDLLEKSIRKHIKDPKNIPHAIHLEIERANTLKVFKMGINDGYNVISTPYAPLIGMDRLSTKLLFKKIEVPTVEWVYASSEKELKKVAKDMGLPLIIKPVMTSSGHGTTIAKDWPDIEYAYNYAVKHARGKGDEVIVERYLPSLKEHGIEVTQLVLRHFDENGKIITTLLPPIEHQRPSATYHESWLPYTIPENIMHKAQEYAKKIAEYLGGLGIYAIEQFIIGNEIYNSEFANRPHDTGMVTRWAMHKDEGALHLMASLGLPITKLDIDLVAKDKYCVAHVILAPESGINENASVISWDANTIYNYIRRKNYQGDVWYFGKPTAYPGRRMGLAMAYHENLHEARRIAEEIAHIAEKCISYE